MSTPDSSKLGYEPKDASIGVIVFATATVIGGILLSIGVSAVIYGMRYSHTSATGARQTSFIHGPSERSSIEKDVTALRADVASHLGGYDWIDRKSGTVRIPVDRAMDLVAEEAVKAKAQPEVKP